MKKLYFGGDILTMCSDEQPYALLTCGDTIEGLLSQAEAERISDAMRVDLGGKTLMPAFIDPHSHFAGYADGLLQIGLEGCRTENDIADRIAQYIDRENPPAGRWLTAKGYDHNDLPEGRNITRWQLDKACPQYPLVVKHKSGHMGVFNSKALELLGADESSPVPSGGVVGITDGKLNGYMEEAAFIKYLHMIPMRGMKELEKAFVKAQERYFSYGITVAQEGHFPLAMAPIYQELENGGALKIDIKAYSAVGAMDELEQSFGDGMRKGAKVQLAGYKIFLDGSPQGRTAWMRAPYEGGDYKGYGIMSDDEVYEAVKRAAVEKRQILAHCNGDMAAQQYLDAIERAEAEGYDVAAVRPVMIHAQLLAPDQMSRLKKLGVTPSFFVAHVYHWGDVHVKNFGIDRAAKISPVALAVKEGIPFTFHQDSPVIEPDMIETLWCAVARQTKSGAVLGKDMAVDMAQALEAVTKNAAWQYFEEDKRGVLCPGMAADMVVLDKNPLKTPIDEVRDIKVCMTIKDGEVVYRR